MLSEAELEEIRNGVRDGIRGPVLTKWCRQLLEDRDELSRRLQAAKGQLAEARRLLHEVETDADPAGEARKRILTADENALLRAKLAELLEAPGDREP